jgi:hypothetical protein
MVRTGCVRIWAIAVISAVNHLHFRATSPCNRYSSIYTNRVLCDQERCYYMKLLLLVLSFEEEAESSTNT